MDSNDQSQYSKLAITVLDRNRTPFDMDSSSTDFINVIDRGGNADEFIDSVTNTGANPTISHSRLTKLISKMSRHSTPLLLLVIILLLSVVVSLLARLNHSSKSAISMVALPQTETNARTVSFRDLVPLMSSTTQQTPSDITNSPIKLFIGNNSGGLYAGIPASLANSSVQLLFVEQVTRGVGIRDLWYDAGKIVSQELVYFSLSDEPSSGTSSSATTTAPRKLILTAVNPQHIETCSAAITLQQQCIDVNNFASSVVWSFDVLDISTDTEDTLYLISLQELALSKAGLGHSTDLSDAIRGLYGPNYQFLIDSSRSHVVYSKCRSNNHVSFFESNLTYVYNNNPSQGIAALPADMESALTSPGAITIALRRNFIVLPSLDTNTKSTASRTYHRRRYHPKSGFNSITIMNESATPLQARDKHFMIRFGLTTAATPPVAKQPQLLYLVDPQAPSDIQLALIDGINWWDEAFQYAGFPPGTIEARLASPDDDPYSMEVVGVVYVRWVHRNLRSYSMGLRVIDPRTGQILHGHVLIGSLRMRQDVLLAEALLPHWQLGTQQNDILAAIIQRHRQLGAHEVGHTLGLAHNFAGSSVGYGDSVMDYPPPLVTLNASGDGLILNQQAYASGIGQLDKLAISFGYKVFEFSEDIVGGYNEAQDFQMLSSAINAAESQLGYVYLTDQDSGVGDEDWRSSAWDNGNDPCTELANALAVRSIALAQFNDSSLLASDPDSKLRELFPLVYLWHRYEVAAAGKLLGGASFAYTLRGDRLHHRVTPISGQWQRRALQQVVFFDVYFAIYW